MRLHRGDYDEVVERAGDPIELAATLRRGRRARGSISSISTAPAPAAPRPELVRRVAAAVAPARLQASGGIRSLDDARGAARRGRRPDRARHRRVPRSRARGRRRSASGSSSRSTSSDGTVRDVRLDGGRRACRPRGRSSSASTPACAGCSARRSTATARSPAPISSSWPTVAVVRPRGARGRRRPLARRTSSSSPARAPRPPWSGARSCAAPELSEYRTYCRSCPCNAQARDHAGGFGDPRPGGCRLGLPAGNGAVRREDLAAADQRLQRPRHLQRVRQVDEEVHLRDARLLRINGSFPGRHGSLRRPDRHGGRDRARSP